MQVAHLVTVFGSVLAVLLAINGFFIRELVKSIYEARVRIEVLITKHDNVEKLAEKNSVDIVALNTRIHKLEALNLQKAKN